MGINVERSLKRLSHRVGGLVHKKVKGDAPNLERISEIKRTKGAALSESNALNEEGVYILACIAKELESRVALEEGKNLSDPFSTENIPTVSIFDYFGRLARYINIWRGHAGGSESSGVRAAVMTMIYLDKLHNTGFVVNKNNVHRVAMVGFLVATKFTEDCPLSNSFWSKVGGVKADEVNSLESSFCNILNFELFVHDKAYYHMLDSFNLPEF